eukprot:9266434-Ditylum_brightwellii.AAC.1
MERNLTIQRREIQKIFDGGKVVGQSGSTTYVETDNETKKESDIRSSPKKRKSAPTCDDMEIDTLVGINDPVKDRRKDKP